MGTCTAENTTVRKVGALRVGFGFRGRLPLSIRCCDVFLFSLAVVVENVGTN